MASGGADEEEFDFGDFEGQFAVALATDCQCGSGADGDDARRRDRG